MHGNQNLAGNDARASWWHVITQSSGFDYPYADHRDYRPGEIWTYSDTNPVRLCNALAKVERPFRLRPQYSKPRT